MVQEYGLEQNLLHSIGVVNPNIRPEHLKVKVPFPKHNSLLKSSVLGIVLIFGLYFLFSNPSDPMLSYTSNPELDYGAVPPEWKGTPRLSNGTYQNLYNPFESRLSQVLKWKLGKNPQAAEKKADLRKLEVEYIGNFSPTDRDELIWLGHASYLIYLDGITILTDPVWFDNWALKRQSKLPIDPKEIKDVDYILISHDHRDHCDETTLKLLGTLLPDVKILAGLDMAPLLQEWAPTSEIQEAGWFQRFKLDNSLEITFVPARHWSRRGLSDQNQRLWGGFYIQSSTKTLYFMGDSGYGPHFKLISETLGPPDYALMGVGAFRPEWFMNPAHTSPLNAAKAFREMEAGYFVPMHFGTFDLSDEPLLEPLDILQANPDSTGNRLITPVIGKNLFR